MDKICDRQVIEEEIQVGLKYIKRSLASFTVRKYKIKHI